MSTPSRCLTCGTASNQTAAVRDYLRRTAAPLSHARPARSYRLRLDCSNAELKSLTRIRSKLHKQIKPRRAGSCAPPPPRRAGCCTPPPSPAGSYTPSPPCMYAPDPMTSDGVMETDLVGLATVDGECTQEEAQATAYANDRRRYRRDPGKWLMRGDVTAWAAPGSAEVDGEGALGRGTGDGQVVGGAGRGYGRQRHRRRIAMGTKGAEPI